MQKRRVHAHRSIWLFSLVAFFVAACGKAHIRPVASPTIPAGPAPTPTVPAVQEPPADPCREYLHLSVLSGETKEEAVVTSYHCHSAYIDSTGQSPDKSPDWVVYRGVPIHFQLSVDQRPTAIEVRLYPGAGVSASFLRWPEELPTHVQAAAKFQPELDTRFEVLPQAPPGLYCLVVKAAWGQEIEVFYAISLILEDVSPTPTQAAATTPTFTPEPTPTPMTTPTLPSIAFRPEQASGEVLLETVNQIGGHSLAVAVEQGRVYLSIGPRLVVLDRLSSPGDFTGVGQSKALPGVVRDVHLVDVYPAGNLACVAAGRAGMILLDITDPSTPAIAGSVSMPGDAQGVAVAPEAGLVYVASGGPPASGQGGALSIVDVSRPETPEVLNSVGLPGPAHRVALVEHTAYVAYEGGLMVIDVSDPAAPIEVARLDLPQPARDVAIYDGYAYVAGQGLHVIDLSDPANPRPVGQLGTTFPAQAVAVQGKRAYLSETFCEMGGCGSTVRIIDVSDPAQPQEIGSWFAKAAVEKVSVQGDALYLVSWQKGLQVVDVSDAANPKQVDEYATLGAVEAVALSGGLAYVSDGAESGLQVLEIDEISHLRLRGSAESVRWVDGYTVVDGYAYVPMWVSGLSILDVRDPDDPQEVAVVKLGQAEQAIVVGKWAYVTTGYEGLSVLDVADPLEPRILGVQPLEGLAEGLAVAGDRAYVAVDGSEQSTLYAIDVADPLHPVEIGRVALQGKGLNAALAPEAGYAYVAVADCTYYLGTAQCSGGLQVVDIDDPSRPQTVLIVELPGGAHDVVLDGQYAFVAAGSGGVWAIDVSDPKNPRAVGWRGTAGRARNIEVADGRVYVADGAGGLLVLAHTTPLQGKLGDTGAAGAPQIASLTVAPARVEPGDVVTLTWEASGDRATLCPSARFVLFTPDDCWQVPPSGEITFTVPVEADGNRRVEFLLTVDAEGAAAPAVWQTSVAFKCQRTWFYSDEPQAGICPLEPLRSHAAVQRFERGTMIWIEELGRYIMLEEAHLDVDDGRGCVTYLHDPLDITRDTSAGVTAPDGRYAPASGFGLVWRGDAAASPGFRDTLGWALAPEVGYDAILQCDDALPSGGRSWQTCVLQGPESEIILLDPLGRWDLWEGETVGG